jgi:hypothetical protein
MTEYDKRRTKKLGKPLAYRSVRKHNVVLNRIFKEPIEHGYVHKTQIPYLETKGAKTQNYPTFEVVDNNAILAHIKTELCSDFDQVDLHMSTAGYSLTLGYRPRSYK